MTQTLTLGKDVYDRLHRCALMRGLSVEALVERIANVVAPPTSDTVANTRRIRLIERLLGERRTGPLSDEQRRQLDRLIDHDFTSATERADRLIAGRSRSGEVQRRPSRPSGRSRSAPTAGRRSSK